MEYSPLNEDEFRLVELQPAQSGSPELVEIKVRSVPFKSTEPYDALSYVWGDCADTVPIILNGKTFNVTRNLHQALRRFRADQQAEDRPKALWIDAICINQLDDREKSLQVQRMGEIYHRAKSVRLWLGDEDEQTFKALNLLQLLHLLHPTATEEVAELLLEEREGCEALTNLFLRPYWTRTWIFQEIVRSQAAFVHCGPFEVPWTYFQDIHRIFNNQQNTQAWLPLQSRFAWIRDLRHAVFQTVSPFQISQVEASRLQDALVATRRLRATDPRDKLYALLGVCEAAFAELGEEGAGAGAGAAVDYTREVRDVYTDFTSAVVKKEGLALLLTAGMWHPDNGEDLGIPSWVPDFRGWAGVDIRFLAAHHSQIFRPVASEKLTTVCWVEQQSESSFRRDLMTTKASSDQQHGVQNHTAQQGPRHCSTVDPSSEDPPPQLSGVVLKVQAVLVQPISRVCPLIDREKSLDLVFATLLYLRSGAGSESSILTKDDLVRLFKITTFDRGEHSMEAGRLAKASDEERQWRLLVGFVYGFEKFAFGQAEPLEELRLERREFFREFGAHYEWRYADLTEKDPDMIRLYHEEYLNRAQLGGDNPVSSFIMGRRDFMGMAPVRSEVGDFVAIILGCSFPFVLRGAGRGYRLVGPCYVAGLMHGEQFPHSGIVQTIKLI